MTEPLFDPSTVKGYQPWIDAGIEDRIVTWDEWSKLLSLYRELQQRADLLEKQLLPGG